MLNNHILVVVAVEVQGGHNRAEAAAVEEGDVRNRAEAVVEARGGHIRAGAVGRNPCEVDEEMDVHIPSVVTSSLAGCSPSGEELGTAAGAEEEGDDHNQVAFVAAVEFEGIGSQQRQLNEQTGKRRFVERALAH